MNELHHLSVIIPCYEPSEKQFVPYVKRLLATELQSIVIVNDGSGEKYRHIFATIAALDRDRVHLIDYTPNRGKGHALKTAFSYCLEHFPKDSIFVTADCDGQHRFEDVLKVGREAARRRGTLILGARDFTLPQVPPRSRTGNKNTSALMRLLYGIRIGDTQTGLRGCSWAMLEQLIAISGDRFEYETNQLITLHRQGTPIREVTIETVYEKKAEDVETVSHFKTFRDSARVIGVLLRNLGWYFISSTVSAVLDVAIFALMFSLVLRMDSLTVKTLIATVTARVLSSLVNFTCNYKLAFGGKSRGCMLRYYVLWFFQLGASFGLARLWAGITEIELVVSLLKATSDILLAVLSYQIQCRWVFANKAPPRYFFGGFMGFACRLFRTFRKRYHAEDITFPEEGRVYVCRHLNMHGCYTVVPALSFDVHILVYHVFFTFREAYRQFSQITFAKDGRATLGSRIKAFFPALILPPLVRSAKAIPVYRNSMRSCVTIKSAGRCLLQNESVLLFPDIDYKAGSEEESEIYRGFLLMERSYYRARGKHLQFVPLYISDDEHTIYEHPPIAFEDGDFKSQMDTVADQIRCAIQSPPAPPNTE